MQNQHPRTSGSDWLSQPLVSCSPRSLSSIGYASCALPKCRSIERGGLSSDEAFRNLRLEGFQDKSTDESSHPQKRKKKKKAIPKRIETKEALYALLEDLRALAKAAFARFLNVSCFLSFCCSYHGNTKAGCTRHFVYFRRRRRFSNFFKKYFLSLAEFFRSLHMAGNLLGASPTTLILAEIEGSDYDVSFLCAPFSPLVLVPGDLFPRRKKDKRKKPLPFLCILRIFCKQYFFRLFRSKRLGLSTLFILFICSFFF